MSELYGILQNLGYRLRDEGKFYRTHAEYRGGTNRTCMIIYKNSGAFHDYKTGLRGSFRQLLALHNMDREQIESILEDFDPNKVSFARPTIEIPKKIVYDRSILNKLSPRWDLYLSDGLSEATMREFEVGYKESDHLFHRYCFPIYNEQGAIIGFAGRHKDKVVPKTDPPIPKWKLHGRKLEWLWPLHINAFDIAESQEAILVESPNDVFHLWEAGIKNVVCMFGVEMSPKVFNYLIKANPQRIIIATHNDKALNGGAGIASAEGIEKMLSAFFSTENIVVALPTKKDFGEMTKNEILTWKNNLPQ